jgi:hypothetical protein
MIRVKLPNRRRGVTLDFKFAGIEYTATLGYYQNGDLGEVFVSGGKVGSTTYIAMRDCGIITSIALQYGVPIESIRSAMTKNPDGSADGAIGHLFDLISRDHIQQ